MKRQKFASNVALPDSTKDDLVKQLNTTLGTASDLVSQVKQAHWNIKGPHFVARHELFDELADHLRESVDDIAERIGTLGGYAEGTVRMASESTKLEGYDRNAIQGVDHVKALVQRYGTFSALLRKQVEATAKFGDPATEDLLTETLRQSELDMWFLESHVNVETR